MEIITVIGAGLAGSEAAWQAARRGVRVRLVEMKPKKKTPAHSSDLFGELVCSNSLRNAEVASAAGLLKEELRRMGSLIMEAADASRVSAGGALAVDRVRFASYITEKLRTSPNIEIVEKEATQIPSEGVTVIATGPLTSEAMAEKILALTGQSGLSFYDAAAPIVEFSSINMEKAFFASRYDKGDADYINCPMNEEQYNAFYDALIHAEEAQLHDFEANQPLTVFEGCMPVEVMAKRGPETLRFGPLKPVGIRHPVTGEKYYAVVQLRREDESGTMFNLVGFQTHLTFPEQRRVFGMIPGLEEAVFLRYGVMHRNTFLNSPQLLNADYSLRSCPRIYFAGQMTGVEGYIESAASGYAAGLSASARVRGLAVPRFPEKTMIGAMAQYISHGGLGEFQPMNANFGIIPPLNVKLRGGRRPRYEAYAQRALAALAQMDLLLGENAE